MPLASAVSNTVLPSRMEHLVRERATTSVPAIFFGSGMPSRKRSHFLAASQMARHSHSFPEISSFRCRRAGGKERTRGEVDGLLDAAGYRLTKVVPTLAPQSVIEGVPK
jgi:hypothetical protein